MKLTNSLYNGTPACHHIPSSVSHLGSTPQRTYRPPRTALVARVNTGSSVTSSINFDEDLGNSGAQQPCQQQASSATHVSSLQQQGRVWQHLTQPDSQHACSWLERLTCNRTFGKALLAAGLLALVMPGRRSMAIAATLPSFPQVTSMRDSLTSSDNSYSARADPPSHGSSRRDSGLHRCSQTPAAAAAHGSFMDNQQRPSSSTVPGGHSTRDFGPSPGSSSSNSSQTSTSVPNRLVKTDAPIPAPVGPPNTTTSSSSSSSTGSPSSSSTAGFEDLLGYERATVGLFAAARPSVVNITHMRSMQNFYTLDVHKMAVGQGSGFIWDRNGHVITNYHIIRGAAEMKVTLYDHSSCTARVVGYDAAKDIAVLKLALPRGRLEALKPVKLGTSAGLRVGQAVFAIGNPFGLDHTLTQGIVSGLGREVSAGLTAIKGVIQTDAAINPGNSGGVLVNSQGVVIGINLGILDPSGKGSFSGVGSAIPIDTVKGLVEQILQHGRVRRPSLGITIAPEQVLDQLGTEGVLVLEVPAGTPAAAAGLRPTYRDVFGDIVLGDVIVGMDTRPIRSTAELVAALDERRAGDKVRCDVLRDGKRLSMTVTLGERGVYCE